MAYPTSMRAIHIPAFVSDHKELKPSTIPFPKITPRTLLIRITHVSPTHVDLLYARGLHQNNKRHAKPPFVLGMDFAGIVVRAPDTNSNFVSGDRVYGSFFGAFAEYIVVEARAAGGIRKVPTTWSLKEACSVGASGATSLGCFLRAGGVKRGSWVLVTGATGGLGVLACQIAKVLGGKVVGLVGKEKEKSDMLKSIGVDVCVRYDLEGWEEKVKEVTDGGVGLVYDAVGMIENALKCCVYGGQVVVVGFAGRGGDIENVRANRILLKSAAVLGYRFGEHGRRYPEEVGKIWRDFDSMVEEGLIKAVVYEEEYNGLDDIPRAIMDLAQRKVWGRAVITVCETVCEEDEVGSDKARL